MGSDLNASTLSRVHIPVCSMANYWCESLPQRSTRLSAEVWSRGWKLMQPFSVVEELYYFFFFTLFFIHHMNTAEASYVQTWIIFTPRCINKRSPSCWQMHLREQTCAVNCPGCDCDLTVTSSAVPYGYENSHEGHLMSEIRRGVCYKTVRLSKMCSITPVINTIQT